MSKFNFSEEKETYPHLPIMVAELLQLFEGRSIPVYIDGTLGAGGHAEAILQNHPEIELFLGIDQDETALDIAGERLKKYGSKVRCIRGNFSQIQSITSKEGISHADGMLLDLGVSSMQLDRGERGMSFSKNGPLDMRMNRNDTLTAAQIINEWSEEDIGRLLKEYGEEPHWKRAAHAIIQARAKQPIETTQALVEVLRPVLPYKIRAHLNPLTLVFQGLRIAVNNEIEVIKEVIPQAISLLSAGGRLAIISFHRLEDRIVKQSFREFSGYRGARWDKQIHEEPISDACVKLVTRKAICSSEKEQIQNPRSRSAKMRVVEKLL